MESQCDNYFINLMYEGYDQKTQFSQESYDLATQYFNQSIMSSQDLCENLLTTRKIKQSSNFKDEEDICLIDA